MTRFFYSLFIAASLLLAAAPAAEAQRYRGMTVTDDITASDIAELDSWGVNVVRYGLSWHGDADSASEAEYAAWLDSELAHLDTVLDEFRARDIKVLLVIGTPPGGFSSTIFPPKFRIFDETWAKNALIASWQKIAAKYQNDSVFWGYELVSEPATGQLRASADWSRMAVEIAQAIWAIDPNRTLVIAPGYGNYKRLRRLSKVLRANFGRRTHRKQIVHNIHLYTPYNYVKQGIEGIRDGLPYPSKRFNKRKLRKEFKRIRRIKRKARVRNLYVGEFSVIRWAPGAAKYLNDFLKQVERARMHWTYHAFREGAEWDVELTSDRNSLAPSVTETDRAATLKRYFGRN